MSAELAMSNPLLQPDGRFRRPSVVDEQGQNRFADSEQVDAPPPSSNLLAAPSNDPAAYQPRYQAIVPHRGPLLAILGGVGVGMSWLLLLAFVNYAMLGVMASFFGVAMSLAVATIAYQDLKGMTLNAIDPAGRNATLLGFRLALAGIFVGGGAALAVIWLMFRGIVEPGL
jgi:hypothetical protein